MKGSLKMDIMKVLTTALIVCWVIICAEMTAHGAADNVEVPIDIEQIFNVTGTDRTLDGKFSYEFKALRPGNPMPEGAEGDIYAFDITGTAREALKMKFTHAGVYEYSLKQVIQDPQPSMAYDEEEYTIRLYLKNGGAGDLEPMLMYERSDKNKVGSLLFTQSYQPKATDPQLMADPPVQKQVKGSPATDAIFEFKLTADKSDFPMPEGSENGEKIMTITGSGTKEFGTWEYKAAGTYTYTISETNNGIKGYTYDKAIYTIKDVVTDENGALVLARIVTDESGRTVDTCGFTNVLEEEKRDSGRLMNFFNKKSSRSRTGDASNLALYITVMIVCAVVLIGGLIYTRKKN